MKGQIVQGKCDICGKPATLRVRASVDGRMQNMELCDEHYRELLRRRGRTASPLESLFGRRGSLFEEFFGDQPFRSLMGDAGFDLPPLGSLGRAVGEDEFADAAVGEEAPRSRSTRRQGGGFASRISEQAEKLLQEAARNTAEMGRAEVDTEHLLLALTGSDVVRTVLDQFKISVDQLKAQIEAEATRGEKPHEGEIGVSPRVKDALSRAFGASTDLGHSYVGPEHLLIGLAEESEGIAANMLKKLGLTPQALRQQVARVVGKSGAEDGKAEAPSNTPELDKYSRDLTKMARPWSPMFSRRL